MRVHMAASIRFLMVVVPGKLEEAFRVANQMEALGVAPNQFTYTSLVMACGKARNPDPAPLPVPYPDTKEVRPQDPPL